MSQVIPWHITYATKIAKIVLNHLLANKICHTNNQSSENMPQKASKCKHMEMS